MSTPDTFRDALARAYDGPDGPFAHSTADAVLASDEMKAIRYLIRFHYWLEESDNSESEDDARQALREFPLPESVIAWVLDDPSPDSPADKPCERCGGSGTTDRFVATEMRTYRVTCPSCRGGEQ